MSVDQKQPRQRTGFDQSHLRPRTKVWCGVHFTGGPLDGQMLHFMRTPALLRATKMRGQNRFDVLDQLNDEPDMFEELSCYRLLTPSPSHGFIDMRDQNGRRKGVTTAFCEYGYYEPQPSQEIMQDRRKWEEWATVHGKVVAMELQQADCR